MKKEEMTQLVNEDLKHIPRVARHIYDSQAQLRMTYNGLRRHDLKLGKTKEETLLRSIESIRRQNPTWHPIFDRDYFNITAE